MFLATEVAKLENAYFVDVDQVSSSIGKKFPGRHGVVVHARNNLSDGDHDHDLNRIEPPISMQHFY